MKKSKVIPVLLSAMLACSATAILFACGNGDPEEETYTVTYVRSAEGEQGTVPTDTAKYKEGDEVTVKGQGDLALEDYTFSGWSYGGAVYAEGDKITMPAQNVTFTATWTENIPEPIVDEVTFDGTDLIGGYAYHEYTFEGKPGQTYTIALNEESEFTVYLTQEAFDDGAEEDIYPGESAVIKMPESGEYTIYLFGGYYYEGDTYTGTLTITQGGEITYTVEFYEDIYNTYRPFEVYEDVADGATITLPETPTREDYVFVGWYLLESQGWSYAYTDTEITAETVVTSNMVIAAKWELKPEEEELPIIIGEADNSLIYTALSPVWESTINEGEIVTLTGTMTSAGTANYQTALMYIWSGDNPWGNFRMDWFVNYGDWAVDNTEEKPQLNTSDITEENWVATKAIGPNWDIYGSVIADCDITMSFDWTYSKVIYVTFVAVSKTDATQSVTMSYTILPKGASFGKDQYNIGLGGDKSYTVITSKTVATADDINYTTLSQGAEFTFGTADKTGVDNNVVVNWIAKGEKIVFTGTHASAGANWDTVRPTIFGASNSVLVLRGDRWIEGTLETQDDNGATYGVEGWNIAKSNGSFGDWTDVWQPLIKDCTVTITFDWTNENQIVVTIEMSKDESSQAFAYTITAQEGHALENRYNISVGYSYSYATLTVSELSGRTAE